MLTVIIAYLYILIMVQRFGEVVIMCYKNKNLSSSTSLFPLAPDMIKAKTALKNSVYSGYVAPASESHLKVGFHQLLTFCVPTAWHSIIILYLFNVDELKPQSNMKTQ